MLKYIFWLKVLITCFYSILLNTLINYVKNAIDFRCHYLYIRYCTSLKYYISYIIMIFLIICKGVQKYFTIYLVTESGNNFFVA